MYNFLLQNTNKAEHYAATDAVLFTKILHVHTHEKKNRAININGYKAKANVIYTEREKENEKQ